MNDVLITLIATLGWCGVIAQLIAYALLTRGRVAAMSARYQGLNVAGGIGVAISSASSGAWPSTVANIIWIAIGVVAILSLRRLAVVVVVERQRALRRAAVAAARERLHARRRARTAPSAERPVPAVPSERAVPVLVA